MLCGITCRPVMGGFVVGGLVMGRAAVAAGHNAVGPAGYFAGSGVFGLLRFLGLLGCARFADRYGRLPRHNMGRNLGAAGEVTGEKRDPPPQDGGREQAERTDKPHQHARHERAGDGEEEEGQRE